VVASVISAIGVMPAIGSFEKLPSAYDTAPTSRSSMYTGLPLIPAMTPVLASGPPSSRARIRFRCVPMTFSSTPRIWALNSSTWVPSNTVCPTPTMPGRISETGICTVAPRKAGDASANMVAPMTANASRTGNLRWSIPFILARKGAVCYGDDSNGWRDGPSSVARSNECVAVVLGPD